MTLSFNPTIFGFKFFPRIYPSGPACIYCYVQYGVSFEILGQQQQIDFDQSKMVQRSLPCSKSQHLPTVDKHRK